MNYEKDTRELTDESRRKIEECIENDKSFKWQGHIVTPAMGGFLVEDPSDVESAFNIDSIDELEDIDHVSS